MPQTLTLHIQSYWTFRSRVCFYAMVIANWPTWAVQFKHEHLGEDAAFTLDPES